jgi:hypothetical protein
MKDEKTQIAEFWDWFRDIAETLAAKPESPALVKGLDSRLRDFDPKLSWEIGPGLSKPWQFVVSPNLNRDLRDKARAIVSKAPDLPTWEFHASRQPKTWNYMLELENTEGDLIRLNASEWTFVLLRHPDGAHEILLKGNDISHLREDERWEAAAITLESILGEDIILDRISEFELLDRLEQRFAERQRPIQRLREAVVGM